MNEKHTITTVPRVLIRCRADNVSQENLFEKRLSWRWEARSNGLTSFTTSARVVRSPCDLKESSGFRSPVVNDDAEGLPIRRETASEQRESALRTKEESNMFRGAGASRRTTKCR